MEKQNNKFFVFTAAVILIVLSFFVLKTLQSILLPFFIAIVITFIFEPLYEWMKRKKVPGWLSITIILLIIIIISNIASVFILTSINTFQTELPRYEAKFNDLYNNFFATLESYGIEVQGIKDSMNMSTLMKDGTVTNIVTSLFSGVAGIFGDFVLILIYVVFLLSEIGSFRRRILVAFNIDRARKIASIIEDVFVDVRKYIIGKTAINFVHSLLVTLVLWIFGIDFYIVWGFMTFLMNFIPNIGSIIATILPFITALLKYDTVFTPIIILILLVVIGNLFGNFLEPKIFGDHLDLSPILILFALIFWGYVWGIMGMILSVPIMSMIKIILMKFETTRPIGILMSYTMVGSKGKQRNEKHGFLDDEEIEVKG
ncbi:MAG TPA: AI-2E family transporter [Ignavibacteria bacterium]|nr:AI-2E family transporter [Ignavibacteria bacterium]